ncbi:MULTISPECIES: hypothetical protein [unclassified Microbacterium]|uniref:hypothetical protein n=1 Tax=unclassified Microbacterium TaxID=2609290 RepID=UPI000EA8EFF5|nr:MULTISPECIES: hypothetical protein [unclassified Microbacterium]MBT2484791.1 hypothetical protein [Microbacterium sp. ISL-108]RKN67667.1 hypothetical protein D7252_08770 [Microbacterium sp. CGR2]
MSTNRYPGISDENAARIVAREPFESVQSRGYVRSDGAYIIGSGRLMNDDNKARDLLAVYPDDRIEPLRITANAEPIARILADAREEKERHATYADMLERGYSDHEAREEAWGHE